MGSCACGIDAAIDAAKTKTSAAKQLQIELLYLDLEVCDPCRATEASLDEALAEADILLQASGYRTELTKVHITSPELAIRHRFVSSPTIRINGRDIQLDSRESHCASCSSLTDGENVDCRVWLYEGQEYQAPPKAMIIDAILHRIYAIPEVAAGASGPAYTLPDNLERFFASKKEGKEPANCCSNGCGC